ncbi:MAG: HDIG domain-containing protein, partial [Deltaproteobacteria bacterium]|nr:HDIG domain-containing protein [Deltaproteobacteria bacterium]MBW2537841.1 HDIG domain-containing protein [Deltaproteobacteria bacterium]
MLRTRVRVGPGAGLILSVLFAALCTGLGSVELYFDALRPAFGQPTPVTLRVPHTSRLVRQGPEPVWSVHYEYSRLVVPRGTRLSRTDEAHRAAVLHDATVRPVNPWRLASHFGLTLFATLVLVGYFRRFGHSRMRLLRSELGLFGMMLTTVAAAKALLLVTALPDFWIPVAAVSLWTAANFDRRTALLAHFTTSFVVASLLRFDLLLMAVLLTRGWTATLLLFNRRRPRQMLIAGLVSGLLAAVGYVALLVVLEGRASVLADLARGLGSNVIASVGGGILAGALGFALREVAVVGFGHVSRDKLLDLTDIESPLLQKMANEAPGSWEHSRAMANLAEAAAASIGADSLLTRVGAYYHDVGKSVQPKYFVENLSPGEPSPHDELEPEVSADAIMAHVVLGTRMLREAGVPESVVEFAYTHHGTQLVEFFWKKYLEQHEEDDEQEGLVGPGAFRYPGMRPLSKETAVLMLVDAVEAASRTVDVPDRSRFESMISRVVFSKVAGGQLDDSGLTVEDLRVLSDRLAGTLVNMYHGRIKYPWQKEEAEAAPESPPESAPSAPEASETESEAEPQSVASTEGDDAEPQSVAS